MRCERGEIDEAVNTLSAELKSLAASAKTMQQTEKRGAHQINKIAKKLHGSADDWNKVVEGATTLCDQFSLPASTPDRGYFLPSISQIFRKMSELLRRSQMSFSRSISMRNS